MNIDVFNEATELYNKYKLCEEVLEYLSNEEAVKGQKYKETLAKFAETFKLSFMIFVHERMTAAGEAFEECGKCTCENCPSEEEPTTPAEPKEPKFSIGSAVEIVGGEFDGCVGVVKDFDEKESSYYVMSGVVGSGNQFSMWFLESDLKAYVEESEEREFSIGEKVWYRYNDDETLLGTVVGFEENSNRIILEFKENEKGDATVTFHVNPEELEKYEDNG